MRAMQTDRKGKGRDENKLDTSDENEAYKDLIAGSSSDEYGSEDDDDDELSDDGGKGKAGKMSKIEEMRQKLLGGLSSIGDRDRRNKDL